MSDYRYIAYDSNSKLNRGVVSAENEKSARQKLRQKGLQPTRLSRQKISTVDVFKSILAKRVSTSDLALILEQLGVLVRSGMTLEDALRLMINQSENSTQKEVVASWHRQILEGISLSKAMSHSDFEIPRRVTASIEIGEETGHLASIFLRLAEELELGAENRATLRRGLSYPITLLCVAMAVVSILMVSVVPKITGVFTSSGMELPMATKVVISISHFFVSYGIWLLSFLIILSLAMLVWLRVDNNRRRWHASLLNFPVVGEWQRKANLSDWARSLGTLLNSGVPALAALRISSSVMMNLSLQQKMEFVADDVNLGLSVHAALVKHNVGQGFLQHMVGSGEASSELHSMLLRVSDYYTSRLRNSVDRFLKFMSPVLILLLGGMVLGIVAAVMLPILSMSDGIS